jgi:hypothetical protein
MPDAGLVIGYCNVTNSERSIRFDPPTSYTCYAINTGVLRGDIGNNTNGVRGYIDQANYFRVYTNGTNTCNDNTVVTYNIGANATLQMAQWNVGNLVGFIHEVCIFNRELSIDEYQKVEGYLCWKYGYNKQLPSSHPNYWFPPN